MGVDRPVRVHRTILSPNRVMFPWRIVSAEFRTDGASPMYEISLSGSRNLAILPIDAVTAAAVNAPTPGMVVSSYAPLSSRTMSLMRESATMIRSL